MLELEGMPRDGVLDAGQVILQVDQQLKDGAKLIGELVA